MSKINYSIIIPHKNIPALLERCLGSIPVRDDVQVIVVDDNSDPKIVDFNHFPGSNRSDVEIVFTKEGKGAGYARNVGLDKAKGKWLVFIDSDDLFSNNINNIFDNNANSNSDIIFCNYKTVMSDDLSISSNRDSSGHQMLCDFRCGRKDDKELRFCYSLLWGRLIKRDMVLRYYIRFSETRWSNDVYFCSQIGIYAKSISAIEDILYIATERKGSLTSLFCSSNREFTVRLQELIRVEQLYKKEHITYKYRAVDNLLNYCCWKYGKKYFIKRLFQQRSFSCNQIKMFSYAIRVLLSL